MGYLEGGKLEDGCIQVQVFQLQLSLFMTLSALSDLVLEIT